MIDHITDVLRTELIRLASASAEHDVPLIIGGGYGLLLRQEHIEGSRAKTIRAIPTARSTSDIDVFLSAEIMIDAEKLQALRQVLGAHGFASIPGAEHYQFSRAVTYRGVPSELKVDLLAPPPRDIPPGAGIKVDTRRIRNAGARGIHAHTTPEAFSITENTTRVALADEAKASVLLPHPYSFLLLKLFAFRDRKDDARKDLGQYHAFDLYRIIAMMTEDDFLVAERMRDAFASDAIVREARSIVAAFFGGPDSAGALAIACWTSPSGALDSRLPARRQSHPQRHCPASPRLGQPGPAPRTGPWCGHRSA